MVKISSLKPCTFFYYYFYYFASETVNSLTRTRVADSERDREAHAVVAVVGEARINPQIHSAVLDGPEFSECESLSSRGRDAEIT